MDPARLTHSGNRELLRRDLSVSLFLSSVLCLVIYGILSLAEPEPRMAHGGGAAAADAFSGGSRSSVRSLLQSGCWPAPLNSCRKGQFVAWTTS